MYIGVEVDFWKENGGFIRWRRRRRRKRSKGRRKEGEEEKGGKG